MDFRAMTSMFALAVSLASAQTLAATDQLAAHGRMMLDRAGHQATVLRTGEVLITGGCAGQSCDRLHASCEIYDPKTGAFRPAGSMHTARVSHEAKLLPDGRVLIFGGWAGSEVSADA